MPPSSASSSPALGPCDAVFFAILRCVKGGMNLRTAGQLLMAAAKVWDLIAHLFLFRTFYTKSVSENDSTATEESPMTSILLWSTIAIVLGLLNFAIKFRVWFKGHPILRYVAQTFDEDGRSIAAMFRINHGPTFELLGDCLGEDGIEMIVGILHGKRFSGTTELVSFGSTALFVSAFVLFIGYGLMFRPRKAVRDVYSHPPMRNTSKGRVSNDRTMHNTKFIACCCVGPLVLIFIVALGLLLPFLYLFFGDLETDWMQKIFLHAAGACVFGMTMWSLGAQAAVSASFSMWVGDDDEVGIYRPLAEPQ